MERDIAEMSTFVPTFSTMSEPLVRGDTVDNLYIIRRQPTTVIQNGGPQTGSRMFLRNGMRWLTNYNREHVLVVECCTAVMLNYSLMTVVIANKYRGGQK